MWWQCKGCVFQYIPGDTDWPFITITLEPHPSFLLQDDTMCEQVESGLFWITGTILLLRLRYNLMTLCVGATDYFTDGIYSL
jgi:hypothetical protein